MFPMGSIFFPLIVKFGDIERLTYWHSLILAVSQFDALSSHFLFS